MYSNGRPRKPLLIYIKKENSKKPPYIIYKYYHESFFPFYLTTKLSLETEWIFIQATKTVGIVANTFSGLFQDLHLRMKYNT